jgi:hypothetical protein
MKYTKHHASEEILIINANVKYSYSNVDESETIHSKREEVYKHDN